MDSKKGTVTPLSSLFPAEEAKKASKRVQDTISERQQQLDQLKGFINDNVNLINLVQKLPDEISHHITVPFGKAAFFPGRLIHTNEFMELCTIDCLYMEDGDTSLMGWSPHATIK